MRGAEADRRCAGSSASSRWSTVALAFAAPSLQRVVAGPPERPLPRLPRPDRGDPARGARRPRCSSAALGAWRATRRPAAALAAALARRGRHRRPRLVAARRACRRTSTPTAAGRRCRPPASGSSAADGGATISVLGLPELQAARRDRLPDRACRRPGRRPRRHDGVIRPIGTAIVVVCDRLFEDAIGAACGGPPRTRSSRVSPRPVSGRRAGRRRRRSVEPRSMPRPRTSVSIYRSTPAAVARRSCGAPAADRSSRCARPSSSSSSCSRSCGPIDGRRRPRLLGGRPRRPVHAPGRDAGRVHLPAARRALLRRARASCPFEVFQAIWTLLIGFALLWLTGPWALLFLVIPVVASDLYLGNIHVLLAAAIVGSLRWPGLWAIPLLTKPTVRRRAALVRRARRVAAARHRRSA